MNDYETPTALEGTTLSGAIEENVLCALCWHNDLAPLLATRLDATIFSTRIYRTIAECALKHLQSYRRPARAHLSDLLEQELNRGSTGILMRDVLSQLQGLAPELQADFVIRELDRFIKSQIMKRQATEVFSRLNSGDIEGAETAWYRPDVEQEERAPQILLNATTLGNLGFLDEVEDDLFSSGIDALDDRAVCLARGTFFLVLGARKRGKSWMLINAGKRGIQQRRNVLHITLENSARLTGRRYVQSFLVLTRRRAQDLQMTYFDRGKTDGPVAIRFREYHVGGLADTARASIAARLEKILRRGTLVIKEFPTASLTVPKLDMYLESLARVHAFTPDIILLDSPDLMKLDPRFIREDLGYLYKALRGLAQRHNVALMGVSHVGRAGAKADQVDDTMISEDWSKTGTADTIISYSQTKAERQRGLARLTVDAARDSEDQFTVLITQSYATGQFCLDSLYMNQDVQTLANRVVSGKHTEDEDLIDDKDVDED